MAEQVPHSKWSVGGIRCLIQSVTPPPPSIRCPSSRFLHENSCPNFFPRGIEASAENASFFYWGLLAQGLGLRVWGAEFGISVWGFGWFRSNGRLVRNQVHSPTFLEERLENFLSVFEETLANMPDEELQEHVEGCACPRLPLPAKRETHAAPQYPVSSESQWNSPDGSCKNLPRGHLYPKPKP